MTSGDNNFNYFPVNQLTKFIAVSPLKFQWRNVRHSPLGWTPLTKSSTYKNLLFTKPKLSTEPSKHMTIFLAQLLPCQEPVELPVSSDEGLWQRRCKNHIFIVADDKIMTSHLSEFTANEMPAAQPRISLLLVSCQCVDVAILCILWNLRQTSCAFLT